MQKNGQLLCNSQQSVVQAAPDVPRVPRRHLLPPTPWIGALKAQSLEDAQVAQGERLQERGRVLHATVSLVRDSGRGEDNL